MTKTLLAVDDSATIRRSLEITFGEDFSVVTADSRDAALSKLGENPAAVVIDTLLGSDDGYALAKEIRGKLPGAAIILLASRHNPYDAAKGTDSGADDFADKPFDTQGMIDKTKKAIASRSGGATMAAPAAAPIGATAPSTASPVASASSSAQKAAPAAPSAAQKAAPPVPAKSAPKMGVGTMIGVSPFAAGAAPAASPAAAAATAGMSAKLGELGLSKEQVEAVLALSREVVEKVVWEVVPQLAETLIKEEIARLTKE